MILAPQIASSSKGCLPKSMVNNTDSAAAAGRCVVVYIFRHTLAMTNCQIIRRDPGAPHANALYGSPSDLAPFRRPISSSFVVCGTWKKTCSVRRRLNRTRQQGRNKGVHVKLKRCEYKLSMRRGPAHLVSSLHHLNENIRRWRTSHPPTMHKPQGAL